MHHRLRPREHRFEYGIFLACIDLGELAELDAGLRWFGWNRRRVVSFHDADHMGMRGKAGPLADVRAALDPWLATQGFEVPKGARVRLVTFPRVLGYVFNPVSFYFVETAEGRPVVAVAEVGNTFGEQKPYVVPVEGQGTPGGAGRGARFRVVAPKHFYVSPFSALDLSFDFRLEDPGDRLVVGVNDVDAEGRTVLISTLTGTRVPLTDGSLRRMLWRYPLVTLRTITLIHWQALRLWLKRIPWHRKSDRADLQRGIVGG